MRRRALLATALAVPAVARAQAPWPNRPIRWILPDAPGGGNDITARLVTSMLEPSLGQPSIVDLRPGAGGRIGVEAAFRSPPDGYTFLLGNAGSNGINAAIYRSLPYNLETDFEPISLIVMNPNVLTVNAKLIPVNTVMELVEYIRARPGQLNIGSSGAGMRIGENLWSAGLGRLEGGSAGAFCPASIRLRSRPTLVNLSPEP